MRDVGGLGVMALPRTRQPVVSRALTTNRIALAVAAAIVLIVSLH